MSAKRQVVVDECPNCGGHWLNPGELRTIRTEYASEEDRERAQRVAHLFRFISPSYYIPGKQDWGSF